MTVRSDIQMKRFLSFRYCMDGELSVQLGSQSSRMITRHLPDCGLQAVNSMMFCRRLVRLQSNSLPSGDHVTR